MRLEGESGRGTGLGPQEALGSGWEASQPWGLGLAWAVLQSSDRCPAQEVAAALLAPGLSRARLLPRTWTSTPEPHAQLLPFTGDARCPEETQTGSCAQSHRAGGAQGSQQGGWPTSQVPALDQKVQLERTLVHLTRKQTIPTSEQHRLPKGKKN